MLKGLLAKVEGKVTRLRESLTKAEEEATRLRKSVAQAEERAFHSESKASDVTAKVVEAFWKGENFH